MKDSPLKIAKICTGVLGVIMTPLGVVVESAPMLIGGFVLILVCSGLIWAGNQAALNKLVKAEKARKEERQL